MPLFSYKYSQAGRIKTDTLSAADLKEATSIIRGKNLKIISLREVKTSSHQPLLSFFSRQSVSIIEKITLCRYMSTMLRSGLSLIEGIDALTEDTAHPKMKKILQDVSYGLQKGETMASAFAKHPEVFDETFLTIIQAGEISGTLNKSFDYLGKQLQKDHELMQKVKNAMMYPAVIISTMIGIGLMLLVIVLPKIAQVFYRMKINLPLPTKILFSLSTFFSKNILLIMPSFVLVVFCLYFLLKSKSGKKFLTTIITFIPYSKTLFDQLDLARFNRTLSTLLKSAVPITDALRVSTHSLTQNKYQRLHSIFEEEIKKGVSLSSILKRQQIFPSVMVRMIIAGEKSGTLDKVLSDLADFYEQEVDASLKNFVNLLEPILMLIVGAAVGAMVLMVIAPIYNIIGSFQSQGLFK